MNINPKTIVIVGGGSAGWMTASSLIKAYPEKDITLIESPDIKIIGVGESTVFEFKNWLDFLEIDYIDFMRKTDAAFKLGSGLLNFKEKNSKIYLEPFGAPDLPENINNLLPKHKFKDWYFYKNLNENINDEDFALFYYFQAHNMKYNTIPLNNNGDLACSFAFHIDANKLAPWLAEEYAKPRGVKHILADVIDVKVSENGIDELILSNKKIISADLYIDCTGFNSILLGKALGQEFIKTDEILSNNKAWVAQIPYVNKIKELINFTFATALNNGWAWYVGLNSRAGSGYVYNNNFINDEDALLEFKQHLNSENMPFYDPNRSSRMEFKNIQIKSGFHKKSWVKNVCAIGLSSSFFEPLASTALLTIHQSLFLLIQALNRGKVSNWDKDEYNIKIESINYDFLNFITTRYALSLRDDTEYWRHVTAKEYPETLHYSLKSDDGYGTLIRNSMGLIPFTKSDMAGNAWKNISNKDLDNIEIIKNNIKNQKLKMEKWNNEASIAINHNEFLERFIHNEY